MVSIETLPTETAVSDLVLTRTVRSRKSHAAKTGADSRAAKTLASAMFGQGPAFTEDADGHLIRTWTREESYRWTFDDLRSVIANRVAVEPGEMFGTVPPCAVTYCVNKGWLKQHGNGGLYFITAKCARELDLPVRFRGGLHHGRRIRFAA